MSFDTASARQTMVDTQVRPNDVTDPLIQQAMRSEARETVCGAARHLAYADAEVPYAPGRWLLRPRDAGKLLQAVRGKPGERALAIRAPYLAQVLQAMGLAVEETDDPAAVSGAYDVIVCEGALPRAPAAWLAALAPGGRLGVVERSGVVGKATVYLNGEDGPSARVVFESGAPPMPGMEPASAFNF